MTTFNNCPAIPPVIVFNHTNIPFLNYEDILEDFQKKRIDYFYGFHGDEIWIAKLNKEKVGFVGRVGFFSNHKKFQLFVFEGQISEPVVRIEWESESPIDGGKTYYKMKVKTNTLLETNSWMYIVKLINSARCWWKPLSPVVNKVEVWE